MKTLSKKNISRFGLGTYLGAPNDQNDELLLEILRTIVDNNINHIDTAPVYRAERSETVIGNFLKKYYKGKRDDLFITSKIGFIPYNKNLPKNDDEFLKNRFFTKKIIKPSELTIAWQCYSPNYVEWQLEEIFARLQTKYIDVIYLHNPEVYIREKKSYNYDELFYEACSVIKKFIDKKKILNLGIATWDGLISDDSIELEKLNKFFINLFGNGIFNYVMMPFSSAMPEAVLKKTQIFNGSKISAASLIKKLNLNFVSSGPLYNGKLSTITPPDLIKKYGHSKWSNAQHHLNFVKNANFIDSILIGIKQKKNFNELIDVVNHKNDESNVFFKMLGVTK